MVSKRLEYLLIGLGAAATVTGVILLSRRRSVELGRTVTSLAPSTPLMFDVKKGDVRVKHYRKKRMPIEDRVRLIQDMVWETVQDGDMRTLAARITQHCKPRDGRCEAKAIFDAVKNQVRYTGDVAPIKQGSNGPHEAIDLFQHGRVTWGAIPCKDGVANCDRDIRKPRYKGFGDCDDHATLISALLSLIGISSKLRVTAPTKKDTWAHIYALAGLPKENPKKWYAMDTTLPKGVFGTEVPYGKNVDFSDPRFVKGYKDYPA